MEPVTTTLTMLALKQAVTHITTTLLDNVWDNDKEQGKELLRQLSEDYAAEVYAEKYVSRFMKMRTLHSAEADVYLDEIYTPLKLIVQSNGDELTIDDGFTLSFKRIINIVGIAGQGKSTILRKLFIEEMHKAKRFPFIIELRRVEGDSILGYFKQQLKDIGLSVGEGDVEILLQSKKIILMLDGYDEVSSHNRQRVLSEIIQLNTRYSCDVIVTTRPGTEICNEVDITNLKVKNLDTNDIISIISKLDKKGEQDELPKLIKNNTQLQETLISPILVNLLYVCYPYLDVVPENVVDFYDKLFITLYSRHDKIKNFNREKNSSITAIKAGQIFNAFCFDSLNKNSLEFTEESLHRYLQSAINLNQISDEKTEQIQDDLLNITCLIQKDGFDKYVFLHKSVQEFHAAKFIASLPHKHKEKFYLKLSEAIDNEDKFDNVLLFLKHIDTDDYNSLLLVEYFKKNKLNHLNTDSKERILNTVISSILKGKKLEFIINENSFHCEIIDVLVHKNLLSTLAFFQSGTRDISLASQDLLEKHLLNLDTDLEKSDSLNAKLISVNTLKGISISEPQTPSNNLDEQSSQRVVATLYDYLKTSEGMDSYSTALKEDIMFFYYNLYAPIDEKEQQVSRILEIDFDI